MPINYKKYNICISCKLKYPKTIEYKFCKNCGKPTRWRPSKQKPELKEKEIVRY